ncbi:hypothetical protein D3C76_1455260 [compost metagenome]
MLQAQESPQRVGIERGRVGLHRLLPDRPARTLVAGAVHRHIQPPETVHATLDQLGHLRFIADIGLHELSLCTHGMQLGQQLLPGLGIAPGNDQPRALAGEGDRRGIANACGGAGDQNHLMFKLLAHGGYPNAEV